MDRDALVAEMQAVISLHGPWVWHNVVLPYGLFTIGPEPRGDNYRTVKFLRLISDIVRRPLSDLKVLDLACGEGLYSLEFARHGAQVVGVEGREANVAKAEFCRRALALDNVTFIKRDVRDVTVSTVGVFDVVLCSGILYHLDHPAAFQFLKAVRSLCTGLCIIDSNISLNSDVEVEFEGRQYHGSWYREHPPGASSEQKLQDVSASLDNEESFWIAKHDLTNFLIDIGFTSVCEVLAPIPMKQLERRVTLVAIGGRQISAYNDVGRQLDDLRWPPHWGTRDEQTSPVQHIVG